MQFNPRNENIVLVCTSKHPPILLGLDYEKSEVQQKTIPMDKDDADANMIASFDRRGSYVFTGGSRGRLTIFKCPASIEENTTLEIVSSFKIQPSVSTPAAIREIEFGVRNKDYFLVNSTDRTIRLYSCESAIKAGVNGTCEEIRKFQDMVNKTMWKRCCFSGDANASHICGGSARQHELYIWETENGTIKKMLQGTKGEMLLDVQWHPLRPILTSVSSGVVSVWVKPEIENWSAYAPNFKELEENEDYDERESEFDLEDEDKKPKAIEVEEVDDVDVDVEGIQAETYLVSSDEECVDTTSLEYIPMSLEEGDIPENPAAVIQQPQLPPIEE